MHKVNMGRTVHAERIRSSEVHVESFHDASPYVPGNGHPQRGQQLATQLPLGNHRIERWLSTCNYEIGIQISTGETHLELRLLIECGVE